LPEFALCPPDPMRILYIVPYVPNLIRVRPYNLIRQLSLQGHRVTVLTIWANDAERTEAEHLRTIADGVRGTRLSIARSMVNCLRALPTRTPLQAAFSWHPELVEVAERLLAAEAESDPFRVIHIEHLRGSRVGLDLLRRTTASGNRIPVVWDSVDCISLLFERTAAMSKLPLNRLVAWFELGRTKHYESMLSGAFDRTIVTSDADRGALLDLAGARGEAPAVEVVANGVDLEYFSPGAGGQERSSTLVISGKMSYHANASMVLGFVDHVFPAILREKSDVLLEVVGKDPPREILRLQNHPSIHVTGTVPDIRPYLRKAAVAVAPLLYGAGIQNKILEAMACSTPVVTTPTAAGSLDAVPGRDLLVGESNAGFSKHVIHLLDNPSYRQELGRAGRRYVETHHSWSNAAHQLEGIYDELVHI
jgi:sugar transferase (PEP-CTERM/EpsH1 system associated)